jgi:iron uptake system component EfeO
MIQLRALLLLTALVVTACSGGSARPATTSRRDQDATTVEVELSDAGCQPREISVPAGATTFKVSSDGTAAVTEFEVLKGSRILGEVENVFPGGDRSFTVDLDPGTYTTKCPGGADFETGTLTVTAS